MGLDLTASGKVFTNLPERIPTVETSVPVKKASPEMENIRNTSELKLAQMEGVRVPIGEEQLIKAIDRAIKAMQGTATTLDFSIHEKTKRIMVKVLDKDTGRIIREIPPEKTLDYVAKLWEMAGVLIDERR